MANTNNFSLEPAECLLLAELLMLEPANREKLSNILECIYGKDNMPPVLQVKSKNASTTLDKILKKLHQRQLIREYYFYGCYAVTGLDGSKIKILLKEPCVVSFIKACTNNLSALLEKSKKNVWNEPYECMLNVLSFLYASNLMLKDETEIAKIEKHVGSMKSSERNSMTVQTVRNYALRRLFCTYYIYDYQEEYPPTIKKILYPLFFLFALYGGKRLPEWRSLYLMQKTEMLKYIEQCMMCAFLENDTPLLKTLGNETHGNEAYLGTALLETLQGNWTEADAAFTRYLNEKLKYDFASQDKKNDYLTICALYLAILIGCKAQKSVTRIKDWAKTLAERLPLLHKYNNNIRELAIYLFDAFKTQSTDFSTSTIDSSPIYNLMSLLLVCQNLRQQPDDSFLKDCLDQGYKLLENGQPVMGTYILNATGILLPSSSPERAAIEEKLAEIDLVPICSMRDKKETWELLLDKLESVMGISQLDKNKGIPSVKVYWLINPCLSTGKDDSSIRQFEQLQPMQSKQNSNGKMGVPRNISMVKVKQGDYDDILSPAEQLIKPYIKSPTWYGEACSIDADVFKIIKDWDNVYFNNLANPVRLVEDSNCILSSMKNNKVELTLKYNPKYLNAAVFLDISEPGICKYCQISSNDPLVQFFKAYSHDGKVTIPNTGMERLTELAKRLSSKIQVNGYLEKELFKDLEHIQGETEIHAQLTRDNYDLHINFKVKPLPDNALMLKPGQGNEQKVIAQNGEKKLLVRNLKAEENALDNILKRCPSLPAEVKKECECELDDLPQLLGTLAEMRDIPNLVMDWKEGDPLKISQKLDASKMQLSNPSGMDWFAVGGNIQVDENKVLSLTQILEKLENRMGSFIRLDDESYLQLTKDLMRKLEALRTAGSVKKDMLSIAPAALPMLASVFEDGLPKRLQEQLDRIKNAFAKDVPLPKNLNGTLRGYQEDGYRYLVRMADCGIGCCLADDMGLGKTIQLLALMLHEAKNGPALVVCPASITHNWEREAQKFAPSLRTCVLHQAEDRAKAIKSTRKGDLLITSYGLLNNEQEILSEVKWHIVILDEAQAIKNHTTKRTKNTKLLNADIRIAATGTPVENRLLELWSLFDFLNPGLLGTASSFDQRFSENGQPIPELKKLVSPLIMRRTKSEVLDDLPPKTEVTIPIELSQEEREKYEALRRRALEALSKQDRKDSRIAILAQLTKLRQFCCDPSLIWKNAELGSKIKHILELAKDLKEAGHRALIFSQFVSFLTIIRKELEKNGFSYQYLDGSTPQDKRMQAVDAFQDGEGDFFLISLKAGGIGLNLTAANYVILADPWWNPAVEQQAADRVHRIGQKQPVTVYRLIISGTVEERVLELHSRKKAVTDNILSDVESESITLEELMSLFQ